jgi:rhamnulose-1-phosphate aldolase
MRFSQMKQLLSILRPVIDDISDVAGYLWDRGWAEMNAGNISYDVTDFLSDKVVQAMGGKEKGKRKKEKGRKAHESDNGARTVSLALTRPVNSIAGRYFLITASGSRMRDVASNAWDNLFLIGIAKEGNHCEIHHAGTGGAGKPSSEMPAHLAIHEALREEGRGERVVLHTHPPEVIALTHGEEFRYEDKLNRMLWAMQPESVIVLPRGVALIPYMMPGGSEIAAATAIAMRQRPAALWTQHGVLAAGKSAQEAFDLIDVIVKSIRIWLLCRGAGYNPTGLSDDQIERLRTIAET